MSNEKMKGLGAAGAVITLALCISGGAYNGFQSSITPAQSNTVVAVKKVNTTSKNANTLTNTVNKSFTITDSAGKTVTFDSVPTKIVVLNSDAYGLIKALGGENKVVGVSQKMSTTSGDSPQGAVVAGTANEPDVKEILSLKAQAVICNGENINSQAVKELQDAGVKVIYINADNLNSLTSDVTAMGKLLGNEAKAEEFNAMATKYINLVKEKLASVPTNKRVSVYFEKYGDDQTAGAGSEVEELLSAAGVTNIAENEGQFATVNNAWILSKNPDMIIKAEESGSGVLGAGVNNTDKAQAAYKELIGRRGWSNLKAVKDGQVYLIDSNTAFSDLTAIPTMLYIAKCAYPQEFADVSPAQVQKQIDTEFLGTTVNGIYAYNGSKTSTSSTATN